MAKKDTRTRTDIIAELLPTRYRLKCKNVIQKEFANLITDKEIIIAAGPAGVGKSYVSVSRAIELLQNKTSPYTRIVISCPAEDSDEKLGFIPGSVREKMDPYISSTIDIFDKIIGRQNRIQLEDDNILEVQPLGHIRGKSIDGTLLLMEEAQNMSPKQMKTLLTRIGENSKFIISGDLDQSDRYQTVKQSGLYDALERHKNIEEIGYIEFQESDIVRNPLIKKILNNYKKKEPKQPQEKPKLIKAVSTAISNPQVYDRALSQKEVNDIYNTNKKENKKLNRLFKWFKDNFSW